MKRLLLTTACLLLCCTVGCIGKAKTRINTTMASWQGHHFSELLSSWGPPQQLFDDGSGGRVLVYTHTRSWTAPGTATTNTNINATQWDNMIWGNATSTTTYNPSQTYGYTAWRMFFIGKDGRIYRWAWKGL